MAFEETEHAGRRVCHRVIEFPDALDTGARGQDLVRDVEPHRRDRTPATEHDVRRMRVDEDIELGRRRVVAAFAHRAAHDDELPDLRQHVGRPVDYGTDVRQRSGRHERY